MPTTSLRTSAGSRGIIGLTVGLILLGIALIAFFGAAPTFRENDGEGKGLRANNDGHWPFFFDETIDARGSGTADDAGGLLVLGDHLDNEGRLIDRFRAWARAHGKRYTSSGEEQRRLKVFADSIRRIVEHRKAKSSYELGLTYYADWTDQEFVQNFQFLPKRECWTVADRQQMAKEQEEQQVQLQNPFLPRSVDWRKMGIVTPVKNQGHCGSCWAFSAIGALEAQYAKKHHQQVIFSEQQLLDCSYGYGNLGCNGGFPARAFEYIRRSGGLDKAEAYPYEMVSNSSCRVKLPDAILKVKRVVNVTESDEYALERAVAFAGPVTVAFVVESDFRLYSGGVYTTQECGSPKPKDLTHAVLVVGYDVSSDGSKYWIVKNSWGEKWGVGGYFLMERGKNMCGIADCASYAEIE